jgi:hypothetical protein
MNVRVSGYRLGTAYVQGGLASDRCELRAWLDIESVTVGLGGKDKKQPASGRMITAEGDLGTLLVRISTTRWWSALRLVGM